MRKLEAVCFDMDGVIIDTEPLYTKGEIQLFKEYGVEIPEKDWILFRGCTEKSFYDLSMNRYKITEDKKIFIEKGRQYVMAEFKKNLNFMTGFKKFHYLLKKNKIKTALVTASPTKMFNYIDDRLKLTKLFDTIITGGMVKKNKPDPEPYFIAMKILNVNPKNTVIIEDSLHGINSGLSSGAFVIGYRGSIPESKLKNAHFIINNHSDLSIQLIEKILKIYRSNIK